jgi:hypothetical protein
MPTWCLASRLGRGERKEGALPSHDERAVIWCEECAPAGMEAPEVEDSCQAAWLAFNMRSTTPAV